MKKIVFIQYLPLIKSTAQNYNFQDYIENGFEFEYWDVTELYFKNLIIPDTIHEDYIRYFKSYSEVENAIKENDIINTIYYFQIGIIRESLKLYRLFSLNNCIIVKIESGVLPASNRSKINLIFNNLTYKVFAKVLDKYLPKLYLKFGLIKPYDYVFAAGSIAATSFSSNSEILKINTFDYDNYLKLQGESTKLIPHKYCVFIDSYVTDHPDLDILNFDPINAEKYYLELNNYFNRVEEKYGVKVVIAAHPKSDYNMNIFNGREIFKYQTLRLIKDCEFALAHFSTSISLVVLCKKPVVLLYSNEFRTLNSGVFYDTIVAFGNALNCNVHGMDIQDFDDLTIKEADQDKYAEYSLKFLTSEESQNNFTIDIITDFLKNIIK